MDATTYEYVSKTAVYLCSQLAIGVVTVRWLLRSSDPGGASDRALTARWFSRSAVAIGAVLVTALLLRAWAHTVAVFGADDAWRAGNLQLVALESRWGLRWQWQVYAALSVLCGAVAMRWHRLGWPLYAVGALALTASMPLLGHAGGSVGRHGLHVAHILASAAWIGSLGVMALMALSRRRHVSRAGVLARAVQRFSPIALTAAGLVLCSGVAAAFLYVAALDQLWSTSYGRILTVKIALVALVLLCGWQNWRRSRRHRPPLTSTLVLEYLFALSVTAVTGVLTETEHP